MGLNSDVHLKPYQEDAVNKIVAREGNLIFSHPVGSGKTLTAIAAFDRLKQLGKANRALVVVPSSLRDNFAKNGLEKFTNYKYSIYGTKAETAQSKFTDIDGPPVKSTFGIVSYDMFRKEPEKYITKHNADTVIFDELHKIKNNYSITYEKLKESRPLYRNFIGLTGSIISNTPADVVPLIDALTNGNHRLGTKAAFERRFIGEKGGQKFITNPIVVRSMVGPYVHHLNTDVTESEAGLVPKKIVNEIEVPMSSYQTDLYRYVWNNLDPLTQLKMKSNIGKLSKADTLAVFNKLMLARQVSNSIGAVDKNLSLLDSAQQTPKIQRILSDIQDHIKNTPDAQIVVYSNFLDAGVNVVEAGLKDLGIPYTKFLGTGNAGMSDSNRQQAIAEYNSGKVKVLLASSAGGEGLNLPNTTLFLSLDGHYNPEKISQAEARGIRLGGLAHRKPEDRIVAVNRYISTIPRRKTEVLYNTIKAFSPQTYV